MLEVVKVVVANLSDLVAVGRMGSILCIGLLVHSHLSKTSVDGIKFAISTVTSHVSNIGCLYFFNTK